MRPALLAALLGVVACGPAAKVDEEIEAPAFIDPLVADSAHYLLEFENDHVRVLRERLAGGEGGAMHSHRDRVQVYLNDADVTIVPRGGEPVRVTLVAGSTSWTGETTHQGLPIDPIENLSIELRDLTGEDVPLPEPDAVLVDPEHHVVDFENERVRVVRMTYAPGMKTPLHAHRIGFGVFLSDAHGRNIPQEGEPVDIQATARSTFWTTGQPAHVTENLGEEDLAVVLVEMKKHPAASAE